MQHSMPLEPGRYYHLYTRGNNKETVFRTDDNYLYFLQLYRRYMFPYVDTFAYCLLPNHFHFLIRVKDEEALRPDWLKVENAPPVQVHRQLGHLLNAYARAFNLWHNRSGKLFQERFKRKEVTSESYFSRLIFYIHFNPQHHGLLADFSEWPHSSYYTVLSKNKTALQREEVLAWFGGREAYKTFHREIRDDFTGMAELLEEDDL